MVKVMMNMKRWAWTLPFDVCVEKSRMMCGDERRLVGL